MCRSIPACKQTQKGAHLGFLPPCHNSGCGDTPGCSHSSGTLAEQTNNKNCEPTCWTQCGRDSTCLTERPRWTLCRAVAIQKARYSTVAASRAGQGCSCGGRTIGPCRTQCCAHLCPHHVPCKCSSSTASAGGTTTQTVPPWLASTLCWGDGACRARVTSTACARASACSGG